MELSKLEIEFLGETLLEALTECRDSEDISQGVITKLEDSLDILGIEYDEEK